MPTTPVELILSVFELSLVLGGAILLLRLLAVPARRAAWLGPKPLPPWPVTLPEFFIFVFLILGSGMFVQLVAHTLLKDIIARSPDHAGLLICLGGYTFDGGGLLGWLLFRSMRKSWYADYGTEPPATPPAPALPWAKVGQTAGFTLLAALPLLILFSLGWSWVIKQLGLPEEPQDLIAIFANTKSPFVIAGLLVVACGVAPVYEELLFRGGLYRFCRQSHQGSVGVVTAVLMGWAVQLIYKAYSQIGGQESGSPVRSISYATLVVGFSLLFYRTASGSSFVRRNTRAMALLVSGILFGAAHANWASFLPLAVLGIVLAIAYEATGDIRVPIVAHALFNLNTVLLVLSGLPQ